MVGAAAIAAVRPHTFNKAPVANGSDQMAVQEATGFCKGCNRQVMIRRQGTNHILHLLLTVLTAGLWLVIWILVSIKMGGWRCSLCGMHASRSLLR